nr:ABC transporter C family member 8-like [Tanacetum cinerariifolium]
MVNTRTDAELLAAVQNALQTLLPQIRAEIREEFRTGSRLLDFGGNPLPVTIHTWLERFNKQKPRSFEKATAPVDAKNWISHMEKIFDVMGSEHVSMESLKSLLGWITMVYNGDLDSNSSAMKISIFDIINLVFISVFYLLLLASYLSKNNNNRSRRRSDWLSQLASFSSFVTLVAYLIAGLWDATSKTPQVNWWVVIVKALVWVTLEWVVSLLLLVCATRNLKHFITANTQNETLSEALLVNETVSGNTSQLEEPSFLSKLTFSWVNPLLALGYRKPLVLEDIPSLGSLDQAAIAHEKFSKAWDSLQTEKTSNNSNMVPKTLAKVYFPEMVFSGLCIFLRTISVIVSPLLLYAFVDYSNRDTQDLHHGLVLVGCLILVKIVESLSHRQFFFNSRRTGMRMRSALMVKVYEKQLKLSNLGKKRHSAGEVVNYIAVDAYRMGDFPMWFHIGWSCFVQLFLSLGVLFSIIGFGVVPGLVPLIICGLLNVPFAKAMQNAQLQFMA